MIHAVAAFAAILVWWLSTGAVLCAARRAEGRRRIAMILASALALAALYGLYASARMDSVAGVYLAFFSAIGVWAWHELSFLLGIVTGPRREPCPRDARGVARFRAAFAAVRDHELALLATAGLVLVLTWGGSNPFGAVIFMTLWIMRIVSKLILFSGAPHGVSSLIPDRIAYMTSYFRTDRIAPFFWVGLSLSVAGFVFAVTAAMGAASPADAGWTLAAALLALAILEHGFLVLPVSDAALFAWALPKRPAKPWEPT